MQWGLRCLTPPSDRPLRRQARVFAASPPSPVSVASGARGGQSRPVLTIRRGTGPQGPSSWSGDGTLVVVARATPSVHDDEDALVVEDDSEEEEEEEPERISRPKSAAKRKWAVHAGRRRLT